MIKAMLTIKPRLKNYASAEHGKATRLAAAKLGALDALTIHSNRARESYGYEVAAMSDIAESQLLEAEASQAKAAGDIGALSTFLTGALKKSGRSGMLRDREPACEAPQGNSRHVAATAPSGRNGMYCGNAIIAIALGAVFCTANAGVQAFEDSKYPNLQGQWIRAPGAVDEPRFDPSKPPGRGQEPPLTSEYQAIFEANLHEREAGVPGTWPGPSCLPPGMPAQMTAYRPLEFIVLPNITYIRIDYIRETRRRIYTDGREWPKQIQEGFDGYSIGQWIDEDKDGRYDVLEVETRHFKGPRNFDLSGIPLHEDNETVIKERIFLDKIDQNLLHDEITVFDHALTRPWTVLKSYRRSADPKPQWDEYTCVWESNTSRIGDETYLLDKDGYLRPAKKDQAPPSLKYFPVQR